MLKAYFQNIQTLIEFWFYPRKTIKEKTKLPSITFLWFFIVLTSTLSSLTSSNSHITAYSYVWLFFFYTLILLTTTLVTTGVITAIALWKHSRNFSTKKLFVYLLMTQTMSFLTLPLNLIKTVHTSTLTNVLSLTITIWQIVIAVKVVSFETGLSMSKSFWTYLLGSAYVLVWAVLYLFYGLTLLSSF